MSYTPPTAAQNAATSAGNNQASLASPLTALQTSITGGNLAPAAFIDGILTAVGYKCVAIYNTTAGQSITNNAFNVVNFDTLELDTDSAVTTGATWKFTCPSSKAGVYHVDSIVGFASFAVSSVIVLSSVFVNGSEKFRSSRVVTSASDTSPCVVASGLLNLAGGDQVQVEVFQLSGVAQTLQAFAPVNRVSICRIAGA